MEKLNHFPVLESYANSIKTLYTWDKAVAGELAYWIIQYWIYGTLPPKDSNPIVIALFEQIKLAIDKGRAQIINWRKGGRPKKSFENYENSQKPNSNPTYNPTNNPNETQTVTQPKANWNKIENIKIENNNITTLTGSKANAEYGNAEVNECMDLFKKYNWGIVSGSEKKQRQYAKNLIIKLKKLDSVAKWNYTRQSVLKTILEIIKDDKIYAAQISCPEKTYQNLAGLMQVCKNTITQKTCQKVGRKLQGI